MEGEWKRRAQGAQAHELLLTVSKHTGVVLNKHSLAHAASGSSHQHIPARPLLCHGRQLPLRANVGCWRAGAGAGCTRGCCYQGSIWEASCCFTHAGPLGRLQRLTGARLTSLWQVQLCTGGIELCWPTLSSSAAAAGFLSSALAPVSHGTACQEVQCWSIAWG
jgi:hypothetical protein